MRQAVDVIEFQVVFHLEGQLGRLAHHQMDLYLRIGTHQFHQADAVNRAGCAGNADNYSFHSGIPREGLDYYSPHWIVVEPHAVKWLIQ